MYGRLGEEPRESTEQHRQGDAHPEEQTTKTTDNAPKNVKAYKNRGFVSCAAHDLNLVLKHTFDELPKAR